jgi:hypothetical protein
MPIPGNLKELLHNKPALLGVGAAGAVGLVVFLKHRGSAGSSNTAAAAQTTGTGAGGVATFDSTGTDIASFLGDYSSRLDDQLGGYIQQLKDAQAGGTGGTSSIPPESTGALPSSVTAPGGTSVRGFINGLQASGYDLTYDQIASQINPDIIWAGNNRNADKFRDQITITGLKPNSPAPTPTNA